jgi:hypothetical protein
MHYQAAQHTTLTPFTPLEVTSIVRNPFSLSLSLSLSSPLLGPFELTLNLLPHLRNYLAHRLYPLSLPFPSRRAPRPTDIQDHRVIHLPRLRSRVPHPHTHAEEQSHYRLHHRVRRQRHRGLQ